jgi:hypothetical protein
LAELELDILGYLLRHPLGEDSIEGIVEWWLLEQRIMQANREVQQALAALRRRGFVVSRTIADGRTLYHLNARSRRQAEAAWKRSQPEERRHE